LVGQRRQFENEFSGQWCLAFIDPTLILIVEARALLEAFEFAEFAEVGLTSIGAIVSLDLTELDNVR
jgi:hypothetical protein